MKDRTQIEAAQGHVETIAAQLRRRRRTMLDESQALACDIIALTLAWAAGGRGAAKFDAMLQRLSADVGLTAEGGRLL